MQKDPFVTLGVDESVTQNELYEAYKAARAKWEDKRFSPGEVGTEACEKLDEIEEAYRDAQDVLSSRHFITTVQDKIDQADALIRNRRYDEAQAILDDVSEKTAENISALRSAACMLFSPSCETTVSFFAPPSRFKTSASRSNSSGLISEVNSSCTNCL